MSGIVLAAALNLLTAQRAPEVVGMSRPKVQLRVQAEAVAEPAVGRAREERLAVVGGFSYGRTWHDVACQ